MMDSMDLAAQMQDPSYWRRLAPGLNTEGTAIGPTYDVGDREIDTAFEEVRTLGYSRLDNALPLNDVNDVLLGVRAARSSRAECGAWVKSRKWGTPNSLG